MLKIAILFSGRGTNLNSILKSDLLRKYVEVKLALTDNPTAGGIKYVAEHNVPLIVNIPHPKESREEYDIKLVNFLKCMDIDLVVLAGFMRILSPVFCDAFKGQCINIHPSLLPKFKGLHTHRRALEAGEKFHGCSVHYVTSELDSGPVIAQDCLVISPDDDEHSLAERVLQLENHLLPLVLYMLATNSYMPSEHSDDS